MSKIRIHELSFCEKEDSENHNVLGGLSAFLSYYDNLDFSEEQPDYYYTPEEVTHSQVTYTDSVQETVVNEDGYYGEARVTKGRTGGRQFIRSTASARVLKN